MHKVVTVVGTRPELIKLSRIIPELDRHFAHTLVHTGQNYDSQLRQVFFDELEIRQPDKSLECAASTAAGTIGNVLTQVDRILEEVSPNAFLVLGDTNSALSSYCAKRRKIPVFHMEAGNRCFDERVPEEVNRRLIDHISDINLVYSEHARRNLLQEGFPSDRIVKTGSPMREVLEHYANLVSTSNVLPRLGLKKGEYFVFSCHREDNVDDRNALVQIAECMFELDRQYRQPIIFSVHPRTKKRIEDHGIVFPDAVRQLPPFGFADFISLQQMARCVISDSGTLTEESSILGFPGVMIRRAHERPEGVDQGTAIVSGLTALDLMQAVAITLDQYWHRGITPEPVPDYANRLVAMQVCRTIAGYSSFVNRVVWRNS